MIDWLVQTVQARSEDVEGRVMWEAGDVGEGDGNTY